MCILTIGGIYATHLCQSQICLSGKVTMARDEQVERLSSHSPFREQDLSYFPHYFGIKDHYVLGIPGRIRTGSLSIFNQALLPQHCREPCIPLFGVIHIIGLIQRSHDHAMEKIAIVWSLMLPIAKGFHWVIKLFMDISNVLMMRMMQWSLALMERNINILVKSAWRHYRWNIIYIL